LVSESGCHADQGHQCDVIADKNLLQSNGRLKQTRSGADSDAFWVKPTVNPGNCFDVPNGNFANSQVVSTWSCWGDPGGPQSFYYSWSDSTIRMSDSKNMCLDARILNGGPIQVGAALQLYECTGGTNQEWFITGGKILSKQKPHLCIADATGKYDKSATLTLEDCTDAYTYNIKNMA